MSQLNRRNALAAVATLPALAVPVTGVSATPVPTPDLIFARIAAHKQAMATFDAFARGPNGDDDAEMSRLCGISCNAGRDTLLTVPTTLAGAVALLRHVVDCENGGTEIMLLFMERGNEESGHGYDVLLSSLLSSLSKLAAVRS